MHFIERFFSLIHLSLEAEGARGTDKPSWEWTDKAIEALLTREEQLTLPPGFDQNSRRQALCPILLWIDEHFLNSARSDADQWYDFSLQKKYFGTNQGGELFFTRLEELLIKRKRVFEARSDSSLDDHENPGGLLSERLSQYWIFPGQGPEPMESIVDAYALALALGYKGRFFSSEPQTIEGLKKLAFEQLEGWRYKIGSKEIFDRARPSAFRLFFQRLWRDYGWQTIHILLATAVTLFIWFRRTEIIENLSLF
ncbi:MAG: DotU family type IV/VI secretion system protein [Deltaproteobacteria bacterium]|jgi:hypothetical protein|nr:DotU family type IV/VI secretion system protein [Deltaproteobacteria bacterium]